MKSKSARIISEAVPADQKASPNRKLIALAGGATGGGIGALLALIPLLFGAARAVVSGQSHSGPNMRGAVPPQPDGGGDLYSSGPSPYSDEPQPARQQVHTPPMMQTPQQPVQAWDGQPGAPHAPERAQPAPHYPASPPSAPQAPQPQTPQPQAGHQPAQMPLPGFAAYPVQAPPMVMPSPMVQPVYVQAPPMVMPQPVQTVYTTWPTPQTEPTKS